MKGKFSQILIILLLALSWATASASSREQGNFYFGVDLGAFFPESFDTDGSDTDFKNVACDQHFSFTTPACSDPSQGTTFNNHFDADTGVLGGLTAGYLANRLRFEFEYLYRAGGGETAPIASVSDRAGQFRTLDETIDNFESHQLSANVYYDFLNSTKFTPYLGLGVGWATTTADYTGLFIRNNQDIFINDPNLSSIREVAGTVTKGSQELDDDSFGYQILGGVDYRLDDSLSLGIKLRYAEFDGIGKGGNQWELLRGHASTTRPVDGLPITYRIDTDDLKFWGVTLNLKHRF